MILQPFCPFAAQMMPHIFRLGATGSPNKNNLISERLVIITYAPQINAKETAESNDPKIILIV